LKLFRYDNSVTSTLKPLYATIFEGMVLNVGEPQLNYVNANFGTNSVSCTRIIENNYVSYNNKEYLKIFSHDIRTNPEMFKSEDDAKFNIDGPNRFSRLEDIDLFTTNSTSTTSKSSLSSSLSGGAYYFVIGNRGSTSINCNIKIIATNSSNTSKVFEFKGFDIAAKSTYYTSLSANNYTYAYVYLDDYEWFYMSSSFNAGFTYSYGFNKSEDLFFGIGNNSTLVPDYTSLGVSSLSFYSINKPKYEFLLNYSPTFGRLPTDYIELDYIESDGSQYIDTNVTLNMNTDGYDVKCQSTSSGQNGMVLGDWVNGSYYY
jgi:hypothetical protein